MIIIGLTGSIGMGKSSVAAMFAKLGIPVFDADAEVHRLQGPGQPLVAAIEAQFPGTTGAGGVDRAKLGAAVFGNPAALKQLESLVHPAVGAGRQRFLRRHRSRRAVVLDIPLLFETKAQRRVDLVVTVSATAWQQRKRVMARSGMTYAKFRRIKRLQTPDAVKRRGSDFVINSAVLKCDTARQVRALITCVQAKTRR
ncbi:MAG: dephospho-CoA kinase [Sphingomonadaceae bacterium]